MKRLHVTYFILLLTLASGWALRYQHHERLQDACTPRDTALGLNIDNYVQEIMAGTHWSLYIDYFGERPLGFWQAAQHGDSLALSLIQRAAAGDPVPEALTLFKDACPADTAFHHLLDTLWSAPLRNPAARVVRLQTARLRLLQAVLAKDYCGNCCGFWSDWVPVVSVEQPVLQPGDTLRATLAVTNLPLWYYFQRQHTPYRLNEQAFAQQQEGLQTTVTFPQAGRYPLTYSGAFTQPPFDTTLHLQHTFLLHVE